MAEEKEQKFYILKVDRDGEGEIIGHKFVQVEGEIVSIVFDCKVFASKGNEPGQTPAFWREENWIIYHLETGARMSDPCRSKELAIIAAHNRVRDTAGYNDNVKWFIQKYGRSPAVQS